MLARANEERKEASAAVSTAAQIPVSSIPHCLSRIMLCAADKAWFVLLHVSQRGMLHRTWSFQSSGQLLALC